LEAKVRLLIDTAQGECLDEPASAGTLFAGPEALRIAEKRLVDLLNSENLWPDVDWNSDLESKLLARLCREGSPVLQSKYLDSLRGRLAKASRWDDRSLLIVAISRLLPAAGPEKLDDQTTRDGWLRRAVTNEGDIFVRGAAAAEIVQACLPANAAFLEDVFFKEADGTSFPDIRQSILQALGRPPLTADKRELLCKLALDPRFAVYWTRPNATMGQDMCRKHAIRSLNTHAGKELIEFHEEYVLTDPKTSAEALTKLLEKIRQFQREKVK
jgi:hypothetical protein